MLRRRRLRKLSKAIKQRKKEKTEYSKCPNCLEIFIDDVPYDVNVLCPNGCKCILEKGHKKPSWISNKDLDKIKEKFKEKYLCRPKLLEFFRKKKVRIVRAKSKSKVSRKDARKAARKNER